ncbi:MAG: hypothetical protein B7C24_07810 [Bacteroidetes bacterium 4572_77]|nr:MAG: hypothetical protein B7C24_07810 [Bacteroidetes bacterium 4572_77]
MKKTYLFFLLVFLMSISMETIAQNRPQNGKRGANGGKERPAIGQISGRIIDSITNETLEYTTVALYSKRNKQVVGGTISQANGRFYMEKIKVGRYDLKISFMGYEDKVISGIIINKEEHLINLHKIKLSPNVNSLQEVVIDGSAPRIEYQIDKKVINVGKQMTSISGTAVDVLENVPSVKVDIEGNVSLRGSGGFTVLIDGRPSVLDANDALQQIPASTIDNIEIITNPSAKYDPDGTAGIINIITKKNKLQGISGVANANVGLDNKYGGDFLINYKKRRANIYFGADYNLRTYPGNSYNKRWTQSGDTIFHTIMNGESERQREMWGFKAGIDYELSDNDAIGFSGRFGNRKMDGNTQSDYDEWKEPGEIHNIYTNTDIMNRGGQFYQFSGNYMHKFEKKGHEIKMEVSHSKRDLKKQIRSWFSNPFLKKRRSCGALPT